MMNETAIGGVSPDRASQARENLVNALRECGELAEAVAHFEGQDLLDTLNYLDSLRFVMAESGQLLAGVVRGKVTTTRSE
jgi:hypothetical protein